MPTYEYACTSCGERLEVVQRFTDDPLTVCPACSGALRKVFSAVGVVFKGSGFYKTDSRASGSKTSSSPESPKTDAAAKSDTPASTESKPAASTASEKAAAKPSTSGGSTDRVA